MTERRDKETKIKPHLFSPGGVRCTECDKVVAYLDFDSGTIRWEDGYDIDNMPEVAVCLKCRNRKDKGVTQ